MDYDHDQSSEKPSQENLTIKPKNQIMKRIAIFALLSICLSGCDKPKHVTGDEFKLQYELGSNQTMATSEYLGEKDGHVYLSHKKMSSLNPEKWTQEIWFTEVSGLEPDFATELRGKEKNLEHVPPVQPRSGAH
jgi:hypothetical protein